MWADSRSDFCDWSEVGDGRHTLEILAVSAQVVEQAQVRRRSFSFKGGRHEQTVGSSTGDTKIADDRGPGKFLL